MRRASRVIRAGPSVITGASEERGGGAESEKDVWERKRTSEWSGAMGHGPRDAGSLRKLGKARKHISPKASGRNAALLACF